MAENKYPLVIKGELQETPSRALWLVTWLLAVPHYAVLVFLIGFGLHCVYDHIDFVSGGLLSVLVLVSAIVLLFNGRISTVSV
jgi:hypothetical protein